jgi:hypothetical protein
VALRGKLVELTISTKYSNQMNTKSLYDSRDEVILLVSTGAPVDRWNPRKLHWLAAAMSGAV